MRNQRFWAIKKKPRRFPRSEDYYYNPTNDALNEEIASVELLKRRWSEFTGDLLRMSLEASNQEESSTWLCDFTCIYDDYLLNHSVSVNTDCSNCTSFDSYLFEKISSTEDWHKCNSRDVLISKTDWCLAWKRIVTKSSLEINLMDHNKQKKFGYHKSRSESYLQDVKIIFH